MPCHWHTYTYIGPPYLARQQWIPSHFSYTYHVRNIMFWIFQQYLRQSIYARSIPAPWKDLYVIKLRVFSSLVWLTVFYTWLADTSIPKIVAKLSLQLHYGMCMLSKIRCAQLCQRLNNRRSSLMDLYRYCFLYPAKAWDRHDVLINIVWW